MDSKYLESLFKYVRSAKRFQYLINTSLKEDGLTSVHVEILHAIHILGKSGEVNQNRIAKYIGIVRTNMPKHINKLSDKKFIQIKTSSISPTYGDIHITDKGIKWLSKFTENIISRQLSPTQWQELGTLTDAIETRLNGEN